MKGSLSIMRLKLKYVIKDVDRHGNVRVYYRPPGHTKIRMREKLGTPEFLRELEAAKAEVFKPSGKRRKRGAIVEGSLTHTANLYFASAEFERLDASTKMQRRTLMGKLCKKHGSKRVKQMLPRHVRSIRDALAKMPRTSNNTIKSLRAVMKWALSRDLIDTNPCTGIEKLKPNKQGGFPAWTIQDVEAYRARHPLGTTARLALEILFATGFRRSDAVRVGRQHVQRFEGADWIVMTTHKNRNSTPVRVEIPISPALAEALAAGPTGDLTFLVSDKGQPFTDGSFTGRMQKWGEQAGLKNRPAHGLRKLRGALLAEAGATEKEIAASLGHTDLEQVKTYTASANNRRLSLSASNKLATNSPTLRPQK